MSDHNTTSAVCMFPQLSGIARRGLSSPANLLFFTPIVRAVGVGIGCGTSRSWLKCLNPAFQRMKSQQIGHKKQARPVGCMGFHNAKSSRCFGADRPAPGWRAIVRQAEEWRHRYCAEARSPVSLGARRAAGCRGSQEARRLAASSRPGRFAPLLAMTLRPRATLSALSRMLARRLRRSSA